MPYRKMALQVLTALVATMSVGAVFAQQMCGGRAVRIISSEPGGSYDFAARVVAPELTQALSQQFVVENRGGMLGVLGAKAPPDGCTLVMSGSNLWLQPLFQETQYDPVKDFSPISLINSAPNVLVVHPSLPVKTVPELIALARSKPGELNYASGNAGSVVQVAAELFSSMTKVSMVRVPYKGGGPALTAVMGGQTQLMFATGGSARVHLDSGRIKALAVTSTEPSQLFPGLPAVAQTLPGFEVIGVVAFLAPAKTPSQIVDRLNTEVNRILARPDVKDRFFKSGVVAQGTTTDEFAAFIKADMARTAKIVPKEATGR